MPRGPSTDQHHCAPAGGDRIGRRRSGPRHKGPEQPSRRSVFTIVGARIDRAPRGRCHVLATGPSLVGRVLGFLRRWWPVAAFLVPVLVAQTVWSSRYDLAGHAADHLQSATPVFPMVFLSAVLLWALPGRGRRDPVLWLLLATAIASCLVVLAGNVRVIDAIGAATWNDAQASQLGPTRPGFESGHDLAELGTWGAVLATMLAAGLLWLRGLVSARVAVAAGLVSLVSLHFIAPGAGLVVSVAVERSRRLAQSR